MNILVTGGAGFIGSAVVRHIITNTQDCVINIDKLTYAGNLASLSSVSDHPRYQFEQVDICNRVALTQIFETHKPDVVMHLAAESHVDRSIDDPSLFIETNIVGTYTLLEVSRMYWRNVQHPDRFRFHHISTDEVYGELAPAAAPFNELSPYAPSSPYSASKASADHLVRSWQRTYGLPVIVSTCSNNYGPFHYPEKLIPLVIQNALAGKSIPVYGQGDQTRDWLYVEDHAKALYKVVTEGLPGETYNIGGDSEKQNLQVVTEICELLDQLHPLTATNPKLQSYKELIVFVKDRPGHDRRYAIDASKIQRELNWHPEETFASGIRKTVAWFLANQDWLHALKDQSIPRTLARHT